MHMFMHHFLKVTPVLEKSDIAFLIFSYNIHCTCVVLRLAYFIGIEWLMNNDLLIKTTTEIKGTVEYQTS